jgi:hypothetical protein
MPMLPVHRAGFGCSEANDLCALKSPSGLPEEQSQQALLYRVNSAARGPILHR